MATPAKFLDILRREKVDGLLLNHESNVSYAAGLRAPDSYALITPEDITVGTDSRYAADFASRAKAGIKIAQLKTPVFKTLAALIRRKKISRLGFESRHLSFAECQTLHDLLKKKPALIPLKETLEPLREIKTEEEIAKIKMAIAITLKAFAFLEKTIKPGMRELEVAAEIERFVRYEGAQKTSFEVIVASGANASYPHAAASNRPLQEGEPIIVDMGCVVADYRSDLTRAFFLGKIKNSTLRRAVAVVREAQKKAIEAAKPGAAARDIDAAARRHIAQHGFGRYFSHALGHGVGLEVHEAPAINKNNRHPLKTNSVFTIEPGIYIPGVFGIRMEEMVRLTPDGAEVLSWER